MVNAFTASSLGILGTRYVYSLKRSFTVRISASQRIERSGRSFLSGNSWVSATRKGSSAIISTSFARYLPSTRILVVPPLFLRTWRISATTPTLLTLSSLISSSSMFIWEARKTSLFPFIASSRAAMDFLRPTSKWSSMLGKRTIPLMAIIGIVTISAGCFFSGIFFTSGI